MRKIPTIKLSPSVGSLTPIFFQYYFIYEYILPLLTISEQLPARAAYKAIIINTLIQTIFYLYQPYYNYHIMISTIILIFIYLTNQRKGVLLSIYSQEPRFLRKKIFLCFSKITSFCSLFFHILYIKSIFYHVT